MSEHLEAALALRHALLQSWHPSMPHIPSKRISTPRYRQHGSTHLSPSLLRRMWVSSVVLPEPRKPERMVQGSLRSPLLPLAGGGPPAPWLPAMAA